jgi:hypothetical protein
MCSQDKQSRELSDVLRGGLLLLFLADKASKANRTEHGGSKRSTNKQLIRLNEIYSKPWEKSEGFCRASAKLQLLLAKLPLEFNALIIYLRFTPADSIYIIAEQAEVHYIVCEYN